MLDYYTKVMAFRGIAKPQGRFQVVVPENLGVIYHMTLAVPGSVHQTTALSVNKNKENGAH